MKALLIGQAERGIEADQIAPFLAHRSALQSRLGLQLVHRIAPDLSDKKNIALNGGCDVIFIQTSWRESPAATIAFFEDLRRNTPVPLIYLDSFDSTATPFFGILPFVDLYVKKQALKNVADYATDLSGGYVFTDYLVKRGLYDIKGWNFGSALPLEYSGKIVAGWHLGAARFLIRGLKLASLWPIRSPQPIDVACRVAIGPDWYGYHRERALAEMTTLKSHYNIVAEGYSKTHGQRLTRRQYLRELRRSKITVSPFGWGEVCYRDFEAIIAKSLLIKPSMEHVATQPDLYIPGDTYVPVKWDLSDLAEKCQYYLTHEPERKRIISQAWKRYRQGVAHGWFVPVMESMLKRVQR